MPLPDHRACSGVVTIVLALMITKPF